MDEKQALAGKTLFVRNLPYSTKDENLQVVFSKYGQLRSCFTVKERGVIDKCRGFGYVIFASREDAEKALLSVKAIGGRPVQVTHANKKPPRKTTPGHPNKDEGEPLSTGAVKGDKEEEEEGGTGSSSSDEGDEDYEAITAHRAKSLAEGKVHKTKLQRAPPKYEVGKVVVVSGLPAGLSEKRLRKQAEKGGEVAGLVYPVPDKEEPTAHVTYRTHRAARASVALLNGLTLKGSMLSALLLSRELKPVSKKTLKKSRVIVRNLSFACTEEDIKNAFAPFGEVVDIHIPRKENGYMLGYAFVQFASFHSARSAIAGLNMKELKGRPVAVDWVVPRDKYKEVMHSAQGESKDGGGKVQDREGEDEEVKNESGEEGAEGRGRSPGGDGLVGKGSEDKESDEDKGSDGEDDDDGSEVGGEGSDGESEAEDEDIDRKASQKKQTKEDVHEGKTIFVRNVPYDADETDLKEHFAQFGPVRYCRTVFDPETGMSRGSSFVQFFDASSVQMCMEEEDITYRGRKLDVSLALSKKELDGVKQQGPAEKKNLDKRNLLLAKEGVILPDSPEAKELSKVDLAKRMKAYSEKKVKLKNPNFFVSRTRLSVRNIPTKIDEKELRKIFLEAAGPEARLKQVKLMRSKERVNSEGVGRSQGYGFVEFATHEAALGALRGTNNNPTLFPSKQRLMVEFAVEDSRVVKIREQRKLKNEHFRQHGYTTVQRQSRTAAGSGTRQWLKLPAQQGRGLQRHTGEATTANRDLSGSRSDNTALKRKRNISGANSIPRKKSKVADSDLKHSTYDSAGVILKPHSQMTKEQPKKKQPTTEQKQKQKAAKVQKQKQRTEAFVTIVDKYRQKLATGSHGKWTSEQ